MTTYQVSPGRLLRHRDYSVRGYAGDTVLDTDPAVLQEMDLARELHVAPDGIIITADPEPGGAKSDHLGSIGNGPSYITISWTPIPMLAVGDINVYVSDSAGDDSHNGLTQGTAKKTIAAGKALIRNGHGDRLWLKKGDTFNAQVLGNWEGISGVSSGQPIIVGAYGTGARPIIKTGTSNGCTLANHNNPSAHIRFIGLEFTADGYSGSGTPYGFSWLDAATDVIVEDCYIHNYFVGINFQGTTDNGSPGRHTGIVLRGCVIADCYATNPGDNSLGTYLDRIDGLTLEWCTFDNIDFSTIFRHSVYVQETCTAVSTRANFVTNSDGIQLRCGGIMTWNVCSQTQTALQVGGHSGTLETPASSTVEDNVVLSGIGWGMRIRSMNGGTIKRNILAHGNADSSDDAYGIVMDNSDASLPSVQNVSIMNNVLNDWGGVGIRCSVAASYYASNIFAGNVVQNPTNTNYASRPVSVAAVLDGTDFALSGNHLVYTSGVPHIDEAGSDISLATWLSHMGDSGSDGNLVTYVDPTRTLASYNGGLGGTATHAAFVARIRAQSKDTWDDRLTPPAAATYVRQGYGM